METVSIITPTRNREGFLRNLEAIVRAQTHPRIEWLIDDDSPAPSAYFSALADEDRQITYIHSPINLSIGEKRNRLIEAASGDIIVHFDDDDFYAPHYVETMLARLGDSDMIKLSGWFLYSGVYRTLGYWDCTQTEGLHYIWSDRSPDLAMFGPKEAEALKNNYLGYGFSYVYRKRVWEAGRFPDKNWSEDQAFIMQAVSRFKVTHFADAEGLCLHILHVQNTSRCFPQYTLPPILLDRLFGPECHAAVQASRG